MTGRHRNTHRLGGVIILASVVVVILAVALGWAGYRLTNQATSCGDHVSFTVAAAPEIAPAIQDAATQFANSRTSGTCVAITVTSADPADVAAGIAARRGATLTGLGQANGKVTIPDVWVPDSSTWLQRVRVAGTDLVPAEATPIASSPIVVAMPQPIAKQLGWPGAKLTWTALLGKIGSGAKTGIVEPGRDASGLNSLLALHNVAAAAGAAGQEQTVAALRSLAANRSTLRADLLGRFPTATDAATLASSLFAAPIPEQAVISYNAKQPPVPLASMFIDPAPASLDYPYTVMPGGKVQVTTAEAQFQAYLTGAASFRNTLASHGLRKPDGTAGAGFSPGPGSPAGPIAKTAASESAVIDQTLSTWSAVTQPGRILAVVDVSGSMLTPVPTAGNKTREAVTIQAAAAGLSLFDDSWTVGLWTFSTNLDGTKPYRQLVPLGPLVSQRQQLIGALSQVTPTHGDTGLYDTVFAAYKTVQENWDSGKVNSVLMMTDGQNDNPGGMTLDQLTTQLQKIADPAKRVQVIAIGIGTDVSKPELEKITQITGGGVFITSDPAKIGDIFLRAIALRPGTTNGN